MERDKRHLEDTGAAESAEQTTRLAQNTLRNGEVLSSRFRIVRLIGRGGMGEVYQAEDLELGGVVALKIIRPDLLGDAEFLGRFRREVQLARQVTHPNVCRIFDLSRDGTVTSGGSERVYFTMEYLDGETLADHLHRQAAVGGRFEVARAMTLVRQMADGLAALHERGIVHRDFKPGNVMLVRSGTGAERAVIGDFGLARAVAAVSGAGAAPLTDAGRVAGTPNYMSPEQLMGRVVGPASDVYALGLVMYEMVTGKRPFAGGQALENAVQRVVEQPTPPRQFVPELPEAWESLLLRCLSRDPDERPAPGEMSALLAGGVGGSQASAPTIVSKRQAPDAVTPPSRWKRAVWLAAAALLAVVLVAFGWMRFGPRLMREGGPQHVVVLPCKVLGDDPGLRVFADGLMETITSRLSQFEQANQQLLIVPASEVRSQAAKTAVDAKAKFGAGTAVESTLQEQNGRIRLLLTLVDTKQMRQSGTVVVEEPRSSAVSLQDGAVMRLANALNLTVKPELAREVSEASPLSPGAQEFYLQTRGYLQRTDQLPSIDSAITLARRALELDATYPLAHSALCEALWYKYELTRDVSWIDQALGSCRKAIEINSGLAEPHVAIGRIHLGTGRHDEAKKAFETALAINDRSTDAYQGLANAYSGLKQYDHAEATYRKAISLRPGDWTGYKQLGLYFFRRGNVDQAIAQYEKVIALTPDNAHGFVNIAAFWLRKEEPGKAKQYLERALELDPNRTSSLTNLAKIYYDQGDNQKAIDLYQRALKGSIKSYVLWGNLGFAYKRSGNKVKAGEAFEEAVRLLEAELLVNPRSADVLSHLARYQAAAGASGGVEALLQRALEAAPSDRQVLATAAETYADLKLDGRAVTLAKQALAAGYSKRTLLRSNDLRRLFSRIGVTTQK